MRILWQKKKKSSVEFPNFYFFYRSKVGEKDIAGDFYRAGSVNCPGFRPKRNSSIDRSAFAAGRLHYSTSGGKKVVLLDKAKELNAVLDVQLDVNVLDVRLYRAFGNSQKDGDGFGRFAGKHGANHFHLALRDMED